MASNLDVEQVIFLEPGLAGDHSEHCAGIWRGFVAGCLSRGEGNCYYIAG